MNLATKDIRHNLGRFSLTALGIGLLLMVVMGMGGIYRGLVQEATLIVDRIGADLWVVQKNTRGPFAELSRIPRDLADRALVVPGVETSYGFVSYTIQRSYGGKPLRLTIQGLDWPADRGIWLPIAAGRTLGQAHYEMVADKSSGLQAGDKLALGKDVYTVAGLTKGLTSPSGDSMVFMTLTDAQAVQFDMSPESIRIERTARVNRLFYIDLGQTQPQMSEKAGGLSSGIPALGTFMISAVLVKIKHGYNIDAVAKQIEAWPDVSVYTENGQKELLLRGFVARSRKQLGLFRVLLLIVSAVIMALILYTLTIDKLHDIAMLKLIGARNSVILGLIIQQALLLGSIGFCIAYLLGQWIFPYFPRRVVLVRSDLYILALIVLVISILASILGIWRAIRADPGEVLS
ncbi:MAG: ABC transporter permease [Sedimentisphaerales bacterium]